MAEPTGGGEGPEAIIREAVPADAAGVRRCFVELQEVERSLIPGMPPGEEIADAYFALAARRAAEHGGFTLVAERLGEVVGYVSVLVRVRSEEPDDDPSEFAYLSELAVRSDHRGLGVGRRLLAAAERTAAARGARRMELGVVAGNAAARRFYSGQGYREQVLYLEKHLP